MKSSLFLTIALFTGAPLFAAEGHSHGASAGLASDKYPLTTCVVSGDKLGEMGDPVKYVYKQAGKPDREIQFCCKDCIKDFEADPAKYLARLDAAAAGGPAASSASATAAMAGCCGGDSQDCCELVKTYLPVADALAADDLPKAQSAAAALAKQAKTDGKTNIYQPALAVIHATDLKAARAAFKTLSTEVEPLVAGSKDYVVMHCPMAKADWVQTDAKVRNPYYGKMMLTCGAPKEAAK